MKVNELFENASMVTMMLQGLRHIKTDPQDVEVEAKKVSGSKKKECFNNSFKAMGSVNADKYVLGYVFYHGIPIEHAWVKAGSKYYDVTLDPKANDSYTSVLELTFQEVMAYVNVHHSAPSLYDYNRFIGMKK